MAAPKQIIDIPLAGGLDTKSDPKALKAPGMAMLEDVQFDDVGGIQTRPQYQAITDSASNTIADIRKIVPYNDELVAFSKDKLWSYASGDGLWTERAEYYAVKTQERAWFVNSREQFDCDRKEFGGLTWYCWAEDIGAGNRFCYLAAVDTATGAVKLDRTQLQNQATSMPKLTVTTNRLVVTWLDTAATAVHMRLYDPADLSYDAQNLTLATIAGYDVIQNPTTPTLFIIAMARGASYSIYELNETPAVTNSQTAARTADGAISVAWDAFATNRCCVSRSDGTAIEADILDDSLADTGSVGISIGTAEDVTIEGITSVYDGASTCQIMWSCHYTGSGSPPFEIEYNTTDNSGSTGSEAAIATSVSLASQCFRHDGETFVWAVFDEINVGTVKVALQNAYYLYRLDGLICAKAAITQAAGQTSTSGYLSGIQDLGSGDFAWCGGLRRVVPFGITEQGYEAKSPHEILFSFDSDEARRTAQLGETLYISGGLMSQFDGVSLVELGFHVFPHYMTAASNAAGNLTGAYSWMSTFSWYNAKGERERSTAATIVTETIAASKKAHVTTNYCNQTAKTGTAGEITVELWRTVVDAPVGGPFYLITDKNPAETGDNPYIENDPTELLTSAAATDLDNLTDAALITKEPFPENGGLTLAAHSPQPCTIIVASAGRLYFAGIPFYPNRLAYTKLRGDGEVAAANDRLFVDLPPAQGVITGIAFLNETLIVFCASGVWALPGDGYDNNGLGQNYGPPRLLDHDVGAISAEAVALTPKGLLFKSQKGWRLLNHGWQVGYVGAGVDDHDSDTVIATHTMEAQNQVRAVSGNRTLVWDHLIGEWSVWTTTSVSACMFGGLHHYVNSDEDGILAQDTAHSGSGDLPALDIETSWINVAGMQGFKLVRRLLILGEYLAAHDLRVRTAYNYEQTSAGVTWTDDKTWTVSPTTANGPLQVEVGPTRPKCESIKFRITAQAVGSATAPTTLALNLTALSLEIALRKNAFAGLPAAQKE